MSEKEQEFIHYLEEGLKKWKRLTITITSILLPIIIGQLILFLITTASNSADIKNEKEAILSMQVEIKEKASIKMVVTQKEFLETEMIDKYNAIDGKMDIIIKMLPLTTTYNYKPTTTNK